MRYHEHRGPLDELLRAGIVPRRAIGSFAEALGRPGGSFRLGAGAQLYVPMDKRTDYDTDHTFRGMVRLLFAGDVGSFTYPLLPTCTWAHAASVSLRRKGDERCVAPVPDRRYK